MPHTISHMSSRIAAIRNSEESPSAVLPWEDSLTIWCMITLSPWGDCPAPAWMLVLYSTVSFLETSTLFQTMLFVSVSRRLWWSAPLTQKHWHSGSCDVRGYAGCLTARCCCCPLQYISKTNLMFQILGGSCLYNYYYNVCYLLLYSMYSTV